MKAGGPRERSTGKREAERTAGLEGSSRVSAPTPTRLITPKSSARNPMQQSQFITLWLTDAQARHVGSLTLPSTTKLADLLTLKALGAVRAEVRHA